MAAEEGGDGRRNMGNHLQLVPGNGGAGSGKAGGGWRQGCGGRGRSWGKRVWVWPGSCAAETEVPGSGKFVYNHQIAEIRICF